MGSWECYCAFCGGPVRKGADIGSKHPKALLLRQARVARKKRQIAGDYDDFESDDKISALEKEWWDVDENDLKEYDEEEEYDEDDEEYYKPDAPDEESSYDPEVITPADVKWLERAKCLGWNENSEGSTNGFISPSGTYWDYGVFRLHPTAEDLANLDPNYYQRGEDDDQDGISLDCYNSSRTDEHYPFHTTCYEILARAIFGSPDTTLIDKDDIYIAMEQIRGVKDTTSDLGLDYGEIEGMDQFWQSEPGEEYSVYDPRIDPDISKTVQAMLPLELLAQPSRLPDLSPKVRNDPFVKVPYDIVVMLIPYLSTPDILSFMQASSLINKITSSSKFWQWMIRGRILPWFPEIDNFFTGSETLGKNLDSKRVFLWLFSVTKPEYGMRGPLLGIANRRRIWNAIEPLVLLYQGKTPTPRSYWARQGDENHKIWVSSNRLDWRTVCLPIPRIDKYIFAQWIKSWSEIYEQEFEFGATWDSKGALVGLEVQIGFDFRVFGSRKRLEGGIWTESVRVSAGDWIKELVIYMPDPDLFSEPVRQLDVEFAPKKMVYVEGVTIILASGRSHDFGKPKDSLNRRVFQTAPNTYIIGLMGMTFQNGPITRISVLQASNSDERPDKVPPSTTSLPLWHPNSCSVPDPSSLDKNKRISIWNHPSLRLLQTPTTTPTTNSRQKYDIPLDVIPHHLLLFAPSPSAYKALRGISVNTVPGDKDWLSTEIVGMQVDRQDESGESSMTTKQIGISGPVPSGDPSWDKGSVRNAHLTSLGKDPTQLSTTTSFPIDGAAGEIVTQVHVSNGANAIKISTNFDRTIIFGDARTAKSWNVQVADEGEIIVGLAVCFGTPGGWSEEKKRYSHWRCREVMAAVMPVGKGKVEGQGTSGVPMVPLRTKE